MSNNAPDKTAQEEHFAEIFARLREQDIEQFYAHYQLWVLRRRLPLLEKQLEALREHLAENQQVTESLRPSALALAVLVRLQSNGVNNTDVLDRMLERGEDWLDRMMQRLDYCEQVEDFIQGDYNQWCIKSLEGAYDWIDSLLGSIKEDHGRPEVSTNNDETTEELLLQKLSQDEEEALLEVTLKQPVIPGEAASANNAILAMESLVTSEPEPATLPDEQISEMDENNRLEGAPRAAEVVESQEIDELEQPPELFGWKDLEDLEAPGEEPVPWYSVDLTEEGATSAPNGARPAATMNDWITILHAETITSEEANTTEVTTDSATELPTSTNNAEQEQLASTSTEPQNEEVNNSENALPVDETLSPEVSVVAEASLPTEQLADEDQQSQIDESKPKQAEVADNTYDEHQTNEIKESAEKARDELEQTASEQETDPVKQQATAAPAADETDSTEIQQASAAHLPSTEAEEVEVPSAPADLPHTATEEAEIQPSATGQSYAQIEEAEVAEVAEAQASDAELARDEPAQTELTEAPVSLEETTQTRDEQTEKPLPQAEDILLNANTRDEQPGIREAENTRDEKQETRDSEPETTVNDDAPAWEEEQAEQTPWYEYLEMEEPASAGESSASSANHEETPPFAFTEIQQTPYLPANDSREDIVHEAIEPHDGAAEVIHDMPAPVTVTENSEATAQTSATASKVSLPVDEIPAETRNEETRTTHAESAVSGQTIDVSSQSEEYPVSQATDIAEQPTLMMDKLPPMPRESVTSGVVQANTNVGQIVHRANTPAPARFTQPERAEKPPKKMGFWRKLFSFARKRK